METNKRAITPENSAGWLASCGFIFPRDEKELARFTLLCGSIDPTIKGDEVDPLRIIARTAAIEKKSRQVRHLHAPKQRTRLVASALKPLPPHIQKKLGGKNRQEPSE